MFVEYERVEQLAFVSLRSRLISIAIVSFGIEKESWNQWFKSVGKINYSVP